MRASRGERSRLSACRVIRLRGRPHQRMAEPRDGALLSMGVSRYGSWRNVPLSGGIQGEEVRMKPIYILAALVLLWALPAGGRADVVGLFDGVGPMSRRSDAVLLVRIDEHVE